MLPGHADAQYMFMETGKARGYKTRKTWNRTLPTDGVWLIGDGLLLPEVPVVAIEVAVSEGPKAIKGSIDTLAEVSPALGILLINDVEIRRAAIRRGEDEALVARRIAAQQASAQDRISRTQQRIEVWDYARLERCYHLSTGQQGPVTLARIAAA